MGEALSQRPVGAAVGAEWREGQVVYLAAVVRSWAFQAGSLGGAGALNLELMVVSWELGGLGQGAQSF